MRVSELTNDDLLVLTCSYRAVGTILLASVIEELLDRRAAENSHLARVRDSFAFELASGVIESSCAIHTEDDDAWYDLTDFDEEIANLDMEVEYLESRGLLERHPANPNLVMIRDESEATDAHV